MLAERGFKDSTTREDTKGLGTRPLIAITSLLSTSDEMRMKIKAVNNFDVLVMPRRSPIRGTLYAAFAATSRKSNKLEDLEEKELLP